MGIANRYGVSSSALQAANPDVDPERIVSGRVIRIPSASQAAASTRRTHRVVAGESLSSIARRYDVTTGAIRSANDLDGDRIRTGQTLVIPEGD